MMNTFNKYLAILMLLFAVGFNLWLYRLEPTANVDPNDNAFQYALVDRTNEIWNYASKTCPKNLTYIACHASLLIDHWVPNWAEGYNLPYYYSHMPQIAIVGSYRAIHWILDIGNWKLDNLSLFSYYHLIIYLLLCFFPLSVFLSMRVLRLPWLAAGIAALLASQISTDGLYGLDPSSYLWRGWGLSSQLVAAIWMPLALAFAIRYFSNSNTDTLDNTAGDGRRGTPTKGSPCGFSWGKTAGRTRLLEFLSKSRSDFFWAILFITFTTAGHLGMGLILFLTLPVISLTPPIIAILTQQPWITIKQNFLTAILKTILLALPPIILLSYWIIPTQLHSAYHNISFWDPVWKFNSFGVKEILTLFLNGNLFDFGRFPVFTVLVGIGFFACFQKSCGEQTKYISDSFASEKKNMEKKSSFRERTEDEHIFSFATSAWYPYVKTLPFLFLFFLAFSFGRTTWGGILDIIPGMNEFHQHRFIVGVHLIGLFLAPIGFYYVTCLFTSLISKFQITNYKQISNNKLQTIKEIQILFLFLFLFFCLFFYLSKQTISYALHNDVLIKQANETFEKQRDDALLLVQTLKDLPSGRVYAGRGGGWGKQFRVGETSMVMYLSTFGIPTILWLPETWSPNSDTEQYFVETNPTHYALYNVRYVVTPNSDHPVEKQSFWQEILRTNSWILYKVPMNDYRVRLSPSDDMESRYFIEKPITDITTGTSPAVVFSDKVSFGNVVRLWIQSDYPKWLLFPQLILNKRLSTATAQRPTLPFFSMMDEATYQTPDSVSHSLFAQPPVYMNPDKEGRLTPDHFEKPENVDSPIIEKQSNDHNMEFHAKIRVSNTCHACVVVLKHTYHPNWHATVNGKSIPTIAVFPFYTAVRLEEAGLYEVTFTYTPSKLKMTLLFSAIMFIPLAIFTFRRWHN